MKKNFFLFSLIIVSSVYTIFAADFNVSGPTDVCPNTNATFKVDRDYNASAGLTISGYSWKVIVDNNGFDGATLAQGSVSNLVYPHNINSTFNVSFPSFVGVTYLHVYSTDGTQFSNMKVLIGQSYLPVITLSTPSNPSFCEGGSITLTASPTSCTGYNWQAPAGMVFTYNNSNVIYGGPATVTLKSTQAAGYVPGGPVTVTVPNTSLSTNSPVIVQLPRNPVLNGGGYGYCLDPNNHIRQLNMHTSLVYRYTTYYFTYNGIGYGTSTTGYLDFTTYNSNGAYSGTIRAVNVCAATTFTIPITQQSCRIGDNTSEDEGISILSTDESIIINNNTGSAVPGRMTNLEGATVQTFQLSENENVLPNTNLQNGIYLIEIMNSAKSYKKKILINH